VAPGILVVALLGALYCVFDRLSGVADPGVWATIASVVLSPQLLGYVAFPLWLSYCVVAGEWARRPQLLLRTGSFTRTWCEAMASSLRLIASGALTVLTVLIFACTGLSPQSTVLTLGFAGKPIHIGAPELVFGEVVLLTIALLVVRSVILVVGAVANRRWPTVALALSVWVWIIASITSAIGDGSPASADRYFDLPVLLMFGSWAVLATGAGVALAACAFAVIGLDWRWQHAGLRHSGRSFFVAAAIVIAATWTVEVAPTTNSVFDAVTAAFVGNAGTILAALVSAFLGVGYGFAVQFRWLDAAQLRDLQLLRYGTRARRSFHVLSREALAAAVYAVIVAAVACASALAVSRHPFGLTDVDAGPWLFQLLVNGILLVGMNLVCFFVATDIFRRAIVGLGVGLALFVLAVAWPFHSPWYPFGAASMARVALGWPGVLAATASMCAVIMIALVALGTHILFTSRRPTRATA
jgi:hypothetical protein